HGAHTHHVAPPPTTPRNNGQGDRPFDNLVVCSMVFELLLGFIACHSVPHWARCVASRAMTHTGAWLSTLSQYVAPLESSPGRVGMIHVCASARNPGVHHVSLPLVMVMMTFIDVWPLLCNRHTHTHYLE